MADREQPYDPYVPSGQRGTNAGGQGGQGGQGGNQRTAQLQAVSAPPQRKLATIRQGATIKLPWPFEREERLKNPHCLWPYDFIPMSR